MFNFYANYAALNDRNYIDLRPQMVQHGFVYVSFVMKFHYNITYEGPRHPRAHNFLIECWLNSGLKYSILVTLNKQRERCFNLKLEYHRIKILYPNGSVILFFIHTRQTYAVFSELYKWFLVTLVLKFISHVSTIRNRK